MRKNCETINFLSTVFYRVTSRVDGWILLGTFYEQFLILLAVKEFSAFVEQLHSCTFTVLHPSVQNSSPVQCRFTHLSPVYTPTNKFRVPFLMCVGVAETVELLVTG
jgi:hypothetical protein